MIFVWGLWLWSKGLSFMGFLIEKGSFFGRLKVLFFVDVWFSFGVYGCGVKVCLLWSFWWKKKTFFVVSWFSFLFRVFMFEYFCYFNIWCWEGWYVCSFWKCFPFEWVVGAWVGWFFVDCLLIGCWKFQHSWLLIGCWMVDNLMNTYESIAKSSTKMSYR